MVVSEVPKVVEISIEALSDLLRVGLYIPGKPVANASELLCLTFRLL